MTYWSDKCSKWIGGSQCQNFKMVGRDRCALHGKGTVDIAHKTKRASGLRRWLRSMFECGPAWTLRHLKVFGGLK